MDPTKPPSSRGGVRSTGSYPSVSGARVRPPPAEVPLGYVIASAFFLAIALVGFGLWIAFEVM